MKALVYTANQEMTFRDEPEPVRQSDDESVISLEAVGICGSDMHAYLGHDERRVPPLILGHEAVGTVLEGPDDGLKPGQRVVLNPLITCGHCTYCLDGRQNLCRERDLIGMYRPGAFAERIAIPARNLIPVPDDMPAAHAALTEPGATGLHAVLLAERALPRPISECEALVIGGGSVGLLTALILKDKGISRVRVAETNALRRESIDNHTDIATFDPINDPVAPDSVALVFDAVGSQHTRTAAINAVKPGGTVVHIGLQDNLGEMDVRSMTLQEISFIGCYTYTPVDLSATLAKLHSGALGSLGWLATEPLETGAIAFSELLAGKRHAPKVVLTI